MSKYRKKPVEIEAFIFGVDYMPDWFMDKVSDNTVTLYNMGNNYQDEGYCIIKTLEGDHKGLIGEYIIKGVKGELYPCKPDIFKMTYDKVDICEGCRDYKDGVCSTTSGMCERAREEELC